MSAQFSLEEIADRMAIEDMYARYVHAVDDQEYDVLEDIFLPDAVIDWRSAGAIKADWAVARNIIRSNGGQYAHCFHFCGNFRIEFDEGRGSARVKSKTIHPVGSRDDTGEIRLFQVLGGYSDVLTRTEAGWRIKSRTWNHGWVSGGTQLVESGGGLLKRPEE